MVWLKIYDSHLIYKVTNKCLNVCEQVEVVGWNKRWSSSHQCPWKKALTEKKWKSICDHFLCFLPQNFNKYCLNNLKILERKAPLYKLCKNHHNWTIFWNISSLLKSNYWQNLKQESFSFLQFLGSFYPITSANLFWKTWKTFP